jgi:hypothetical protein
VEVLHGLDDDGGCDPLLPPGEGESRGEAGQNPVEVVPVHRDGPGGGTPP